MSKMKQIQVSLLKEREEKNPEAFARKRLIFYLLTAMVATRLIHAILNAAYCFIHAFPLRPFEYVMMFLMVLIAALFSLLIYRQGSIALVYLAALGGVLSLFNAYRDNLMALFFTGDCFYSVIVFLFFSTVLLQIFSMLFIRFDKKCRQYLRAMSEISKEVMERMTTSQR